MDRWGNWEKQRMNEFVIAGEMMVVIHLVAGWPRPRLAVIVSGILWLLYAVYEHLGATGPKSGIDRQICWTSK